MTQYAPQPRVQEHTAEQEEPMSAPALNTFVAIQYQPLLVQRAASARWAIRELGVDPWLALSHVVWPTSTQLQ